MLEKQSNTPKALARHLQAQLDAFGKPVSLDAAHALMTKHPQAEVKQAYADLVVQVRERNANRDPLRSNHRIRAITEIAEHGAIRYLLSFLKTRRYDEKTRTIRRASG